MDLSVKYGTKHLDWEEVCNLIRRAPLGTRDPEKLRYAAESSHTVCSAFMGDRLLGFGRAISDGQYQSAIYDVVVIPEMQNRGIGKSIMKALLSCLPKETTVLIYSAPGKEGFYRPFGFCNLKTGMGLFPNPELSRSKGYLE
ncbi:MAG: GNAT family N-acetyltransferase [Pseudomonadota bacterium]